MKIWKSVIAVAAVAALTLTGSAANASEAAPGTTSVKAAATAAVASSSPTGQYEWVCVLTNGNSWSMTNGQPLTQCHGSYLHKYLNGVRLQVINITAGSVKATASIACVATITAELILVLTPGGGWVWLAKTATRAALAASNPCRA